MPIYTKTGLPANEILKMEKIQILEDIEIKENEGINDKIIQIVILNLMPLKKILNYSYLENCQIPKKI